MKIWKKHPEFIDYEISDAGDVRSIISQRELKQKVTGRGYNYLGIYKSKKQYWKVVHRLVLETYCREFKPKEVANHKDGNKLNNHLENLEICTISENNKHAYQCGLKLPTRIYGTNNGNSKYTQYDIDNMRTMFVFGYSKAEIARIYRVPRSYISQVVRFKIWA